MTHLEKLEDDLRTARVKVSAYKIAQAIARKEDPVRFTVSNQHTELYVSIGSEQITIKSPHAEEFLRNLAEYLQNI